METIIDFFNEFSAFDTIYLFITLWTLFECTKKGFLLSILSASKWLLAYVITLFLFPKAKPYVEDLLDSEYILDIFLGISLFVVVIFLILLTSILPSCVCLKFVLSPKSHLHNDVLEHPLNHT